jgi:hypothetical protein
MKEEMKENTSLLLKKFNPGSQNMHPMPIYKRSLQIQLRAAMCLPKTKKKRDSVSNKERN